MSKKLIKSTGVTAPQEVIDWLQEHEITVLVSHEGDLWWVNTPYRFGTSFVHDLTGLIGGTSTIDTDEIEVVDDSWLASLRRLFHETDVAATTAMSQINIDSDESQWWKILRMHLVAPLVNNVFIHAHPTHGLVTGMATMLIDEQGVFPELAPWSFYDDHTSAAAANAALTNTGFWTNTRSFVWDGYKSFIATLIAPESGWTYHENGSAVICLWPAVNVEPSFEVLHPADREVARDTLVLCGHPSTISAWVDFLTNNIKEVLWDKIFLWDSINYVFNRFTCGVEPRAEATRWNLPEVTSVWFEVGENKYLSHDFVQNTQRLQLTERPEEFELILTQRLFGSDYFPIIVKRSGQNTECLNLDLSASPDYCRGERLNRAWSYVGLNSVGRVGDRGLYLSSGRDEAGAGYYPEGDMDDPAKMIIVGIN